MAHSLLRAFFLTTLSIQLSHTGVFSAEKTKKKTAKVLHAAKIHTAHEHEKEKSHKRSIHLHSHAHHHHISPPPAPAAPLPTANQYAGYWQVPGTSTYLRLYGYVKVDAIYDANCFTGDASSLPTLPLKGWDTEASRHGVFRMHARASRLFFASQTDTSMGPFQTTIVGDFFGSNNFGDRLSRSNISANGMNFRLREAYGQFRNWVAGQKTSTFYDLDAWGSWVEFNGPNSPVRHLMIRYEHAINKNWLFHIAAESTPSEYTNEQGQLQENSAFLGGNTTGNGIRVFPDLIMSLRYQGTLGHVKLSLLGREQGIKRIQNSASTDQPNLNSKSFGWGAAFSGRWKTTQRDSLFGQVNFGRGIGHYIFELPGQAMTLVGENLNVDGAAGPGTTYLRSIGTQWRPQTAWVLLVGYEHYWTETLKSNIAFANSQVRTPNFVLSPRLATGGGTGVAPITKTIRHWIGNIIWTPIKNFDVGLEYSHYRRETTGNLTGLGNRFQLGLKYSF